MASFFEYLPMHLRGSPVAQIKQALTICQRAAISVTPVDLERHSLSGGNVLALAKGLATAKDLGVETDFMGLAVCQLAGRDLMELVLESSKRREMRIETFSPRRPDLLRGFTRDQREVAASIDLVYFLSPSQLTFSYNLTSLHERLGAAVSVFINTAPDHHALVARKFADEAELLLIAREMLPGVRQVTLAYH